MSEHTVSAGPTMGNRLTVAGLAGALAGLACSAIDRGLGWELSVLEASHLTVVVQFAVAVAWSRWGRLPARASTACVALLAAVLLAGCTSVQERPATTQLAVQYATMKVIEQAEDPEERRARIAEIAEIALAAASGDDVLVSAVETAAREAIHWDDLAPSDQLLAEYLIVMVAAELRARAGGGWLQGEALVSARQVLAWVLIVANPNAEITR